MILSQLEMQQVKIFQYQEKHILNFLFKRMK